MYKFSRIAWRKTRKFYKFVENKSDIFEANSFRYWFWKKKKLIKAKDDKFLRESYVLSEWSQKLSQLLEMLWQGKPWRDAISWKIIRRSQSVMEMPLGFLTSREPVMSESEKNVDEERKSAKRNDWDARRRKTRQCWEDPWESGWG